MIENTADLAALEARVTQLHEKYLHLAARERPVSDASVGRAARHTSVSVGLCRRDRLAQNTEP